MDRRQKSTLRAHNIRLADELIVNEDFFASLQQNKIFTDGMLQIIKNVKGPRVQVYKMLELLEKRGPDAYDNFVWILRESFSWLADELEDTYKRKQKEKSSDLPKQEPMNKTRVPISILISTSANSSINPARKRVNFKSETTDPKDDQKDYYNVDEQDGDTCEMKTIRKQFADKCMSPIHIIEILRQPFQHDFSTGPDEDDSKDVSEQADIEDDTGNDKNQDAQMSDDDDDSVFDDDNSDASDLSGSDDDDDDDADLEDGEIFYDRMRRESEINETENNDSVQMGANNDVDGDIEQVQGGGDADNSSIESDQTEDNSEMQDMYAKLLEYTKSVTEPDINLCQMGITYKMINELIDKLIADNENGEGSVKMVQKCLNLFSEEDRKFPLNKIIEKLMEEEADKSKRLSEEVRKTHQMANDMYNHSQDMKNIEQMIKDKENAEESVKMVQKCLNLFQEKDRKFSLNKIIVKLMEEKADKSRKFEEYRKTNEMAKDAYNNSQEKKNKENGEESIKMVQKCLNLFPEKDRKFPLDKVIVKLMEEKDDKGKKLSEEKRKTNVMAKDAYKHSQEMKNIEKKVDKLEEENKWFQTNLNVDQMRIQELEKKLKESEEIRQGGTEEKPLPTQRNQQRRFKPRTQSPRKPGSQMTNIRGAYTGDQGSPRQGASSAWRRQPKH